VVGATSLWMDGIHCDVVGIKVGGPSRERKGRRKSFSSWRNSLRGKAGHCYEADVVKAPDWFFCVLGWFLRFAGVSEERASSCLTQKTVTAQCEAKLAQERNGIDGRGPRSGKQTVYAGFDLEHA
jgi:hypothetical protein